MRRFLFVAIFLCILFALEARTVKAASASLSLTPNAQSVNLGETFSIKIKLNTDGVAVNRVLTKITYPANLVTPQSLDFSNSFIDFWYQNNISQTPGVLILEGGVSGGGANGTDLEVATINFESSNSGNADIAFSQDSGVYQTSDGTNILRVYSSATVTINQGASPTPIPTITPIITTTLTPTPSTLPRSGVTTPTLFTTILALGFIFGGVVLLRRL